MAELLGQASRDASAFSQELLNMPTPGHLAACGLSFAIVYRMLHTSLEVAVKDAQSVLAQAINNPEHKLLDKPDQQPQPRA